MQMMVQTFYVGDGYPLTFPDGYAPAELLNYEEQPSGHKLTFLLVETVEIVEQDPYHNVRSLFDD